MTRLFVTFSALAFLAACGDPLAKVDRLSSIDLAEDAPMASVLVDPEAERASVQRRGGLFGRLLGGAPPDPDPEPMSELESVSDPEREIAALSPESTEDSALGPVQVAAQAAPAAAPTPERRGLLGFFRGASPDAAPAVAAIAASPEPITAGTTDAAVVAAITPELAKTDTLTAQSASAEARPRTGLFGLLTGARAKTRDDAGPEQVRTASFSPAAAGPAALPEAEPKRGLFNRERPHKGPDVQVVPFGTRLPSGVVARVCDLPRGRLGLEVGKYPERGRGYKMYDSAPGGSGLRPFYVTGFDDGCARTFTAALALFGSASMHEQLRYGLPSSQQPYSLTDKAYEGIKVAICGVSRRQPCGEKVDRLEKDTVFISIYDRLGSNSTWSNVLLHKGWVLAADRKG